MSNFFAQFGSGPFTQSISPMNEMLAYEALWSQPKASFKTIADKFRAGQNCVPSDFVTLSEIEETKRLIKKIISGNNLERFGVRVNGTIDYPEKLRDARNPVEILYYQGDWDLVYTPSVAVVGSRKVSDEGRRRARKLVQGLVADGYTIVSGLAEGVDTEAHTAALEYGGKTIAVIGTPLSHVYPKCNAQLQDTIKKEHLLISQVPFVRYENQDYRVNRAFFPERNITMSALTDATVIIEASDTSGTLYQARAALAQGRKLFILNSCFENPQITWPSKFEKKGAIRVREYSDIRDYLIAKDTISD